MSQSPVQKFTEALENWQEANRNYHRAKAGYDGYSPDYHLHYEIEAQRRATQQMQEAFVEAVKDAVEQLTNQERIG